MTIATIDLTNDVEYLTKEGGKPFVVIPLSLWEALIAQNSTFRSVKNGLSKASSLPETTIDDVAGCLAYTGKPKSLEEMDEGIRAGIMEAWGDRS